MKYLLYGDGPDKEKIEKIVTENKKLSEKIKFLGKINYCEMKDIYTKANVLIMPSIRETSGNVMLEAMAQKVPVIAYNKFGAAILLNKEFAWLYDGNTRDEIIENLSLDIKEAIENYKLVKLKGEKSFSKVKEYLFENKIKHYNDIYKKILSKQ